MVHIGIGRGRPCAPTTCRPTVGRGRLARSTELRALSKLHVNWQGIVEEDAYDREMEGWSRGQAELALEGNDR